MESTRPDLAFIANTLARHSSKPTQWHWKSLKQVARYFLYTPRHGILLARGDGLIRGASDADFANYVDTRRSKYEYIVQHGSNPISWTSKRIKTVVDSTFAAEYIAASVTSQQMKWICTLYHQITNLKSPPSPLLMDNQGAITGAKSAAPTKKTKIH